MLNAEATTRLLNDLPLEQGPQELVDSFVGENHLHTGKELSHIMARKREGQWRRLFDRMLPFAKHGYGEVLLAVRDLGMTFDELEGSAEDRGVYCTPVLRKCPGSRRNVLLSWDIRGVWHGDALPNAAGDSMGQQLRRAMQNARQHRNKSLWARFFESHLLPRARRGDDELVMWPQDLEYIFHGRGADIDSLAMQNGVQCRRDSGWSEAWWYVLSWDSVFVEDLPVRPCSGLELVQEVRLARERVWEDILQSKLLPAARKGFMSWSVDCEDLEPGRYYRRDRMAGLMEVVGAFAKIAGVQQVHKSIHTFTFFWHAVPHSCTDFWGGTQSSRTGINLLREARQARRRSWESFFQERLLPRAEQGFDKMGFDIAEAVRLHPWFFEKTQRGDVTSIGQNSAILAHEFAVQDYARNMGVRVALERNSFEGEVVFSW